MHRDGLDLLRVFTAHDVRFLVVGAHAVGYWAEPRATGDLDIWTEPNADNARRAWAALVEFGAPLAGLTVEDLAIPGIIYQMGVPPYRIDVITELSGIDFAAGWEGHAEATIKDVRVPIISRAALVANKRAVGRPKDLMDLDLLERHQPPATSRKRRR
ncbi:MAG: hypothetical protein MUF10_17160 [Thermoanaerobaculaceae bacterium]|nr:hypothetical protein [Thermoanaerobaculaceae bacterium]